MAKRKKKKRGRGRRKTAEEGEGRLKQVNFRTTEVGHSALKAIAAREGSTISSLLQRYVNEGMSRWLKSAKESLDDTLHDKEEDL